MKIKLTKNNLLSCDETIMIRVSRDIKETEIFYNMFCLTVKYTHTSEDLM